MIPEAFATTTIAREGDAGAAWLAELPAIVDDLLDRWQCEPDGEVMYGGVGVIVPVRHAVLKVSFPHPGNVHEPDAFVACTPRLRSSIVNAYGGGFSCTRFRVRSGDAGTDFAEPAVDHSWTR